jgi:hypothetical protein
MRLTQKTFPFYAKTPCNWLSLPPYRKNGQRRLRRGTENPPTAAAGRSRCHGCSTLPSALARHLAHPHAPARLPALPSPRQASRTSPRAHPGRTRITRQPAPQTPQAPQHRSSAVPDHAREHQHQGRSRPGAGRIISNPPSPRLAPSSSRFARATAAVNCRRPPRHPAFPTCQRKNRRDAVAPKHARFVPAP